MHTPPGHSLSTTRAKQSKAQSLKCPTYLCAWYTYLLHEPGYGTWVMGTWRYGKEQSFLSVSLRCNVIFTVILIMHEWRADLPSLRNPDGFICMNPHFTDLYGVCRENWKCKRKKNQRRKGIYFAVFCDSLRCQPDHLISEPSLSQKSYLSWESWSWILRGRKS